MRLRESTTTRNGGVGIGVPALATMLCLLLGLSGCGKEGGSGAPAEADSHASEGHGDEEGEHGGEEHGDREEWHVELSADQASAIGLETVRAGPRRLEERLVTPAMVADNLDAQAHVTPVLPGIVRSVEAHLGQIVEEGQVLAEIQSAELGRAVSDVIEAEALLRAAERSLERETALLERGVALATTIVEREKKLAAEAISTLRPLFEAERGLQTARLERDRRRIELEAEVERRSIRLAAALRTLEVYGIDPSALEDEKVLPRLRSGLFRLAAPVGGVVVDRDITLNERVGLDSVVYRIQDLSRVWVEASVFEKDVARVRTGARAQVRLDALPGVVFDGEVTFISYRVDRESRVLPVRIEFDNRDGDSWGEPWPARPGMFGSAAIVVGMRDAPVVVPEKAIVHEPDGDRIFVRTGERSFVGRRVRCSEPIGGFVEVLSGVEAGEEVAVSGTFALKSMARAEELGEGHEH